MASHKSARQETVERLWRTAVHARNGSELHQDWLKTMARYEPEPKISRAALGILASIQSANGQCSAR